MRCWQARKKLNDFSFEKSQIANDKTLVDHLSNCSACASLVSAEATLKSDLQVAAIDDTEETISFATFRSQVECRVASLSHSEQPVKRENNLMVALQKFYSKRPTLSIGMGAVAVILLLSALIPVSYNKTIGYEVAFAGVDKNLALDSDKLNKLLVKLGIEGAEFEVSGCEATCNVHFTSLQSADDAKLVTAAFNHFGNVVLLEPIHETYEVKSGNFITKFTTRAESMPERLEIVIGDDLHFSSGENVAKVLIELLGEDYHQFGIWVTSENESIDLDEGSHKFFFSSVDSSFDCNMLTECIDADGNIVVIMNGDTLSLSDFEGMGNSMFGVRFEFESDDALYESADDAFSDDEELVAKELPIGYELSQNYPNPFNPSTTINYSVPKSQQVSIVVINTMGQVVATLVDEVVSGGQHSVDWDSRNDNGVKVASGIYFYRFIADEINEVKKMVLMK